MSVDANSDDESDARNWVRQRDDEQPVALWDERTGEMTRPPKKRPSAREQVAAMVSAALRRTRNSGS